MIRHLVTVGSLVWLSAPSVVAQTSAPQLHLLAQTSEYRVVVEPLAVAPGNSRTPAADPPALSFVLPADGWMHGYSIRLFDRAGRRLPQRMLHHLNLMVRSERELFSYAMLRVGAAGPETEPVRLPRVLGLPVRRGDVWLMTFALFNPTDSAFAGVRLEVTLPFTPSTAAVGALSVYPLSVAIGTPGQPNLFDLPPGRSEHVWEGSPAIAGRILGLSGHMHRYGVALRLEDRTAGRVLWTATPLPATDSEVLAVPRTHFFWPMGIRIRPDHVYRVTAVYENPTGRTLVNGGMGVVGGAIHIAHGGQWPVVDTRQAQYLSDLAGILAPPKVHVHHGYYAGGRTAPP